MGHTEVVRDLVSDTCSMLVGLTEFRGGVEDESKENAGTSRGG